MLKKLITISITAIASLQAATTYDKSLTDGNDDLNYWSDTTSTSLTNHTLVGATEVFTIGSRKNIPNVPTPIKVSTNKLCSDDRKGLVSCSKTDSLEPRYTDNGLATSGEANLRTWYKATTPKSVNGVVDEPCSALDNTGSVVNWWVNFPSLRCERTITTYTPKINSTIYTAKVDSDLFSNKLSSITTTGGINIYADKVNSDLFTNKTNPSFTISGQIGKDYDHNIGVIGIRGSGSKLDFYCGSTSLNSGLMNDGNYLCGSVIFSNASFTISGQIGKDYDHNTGLIGLRANGSKIDAYCGSTGLSSGVMQNPLVGSINFSGTCPSGYTDNVSNCKKTTLVCPDASWSDNGGNCTKVTPIVSVTNYYCPATYSDMGTYCKKTIQICPDPSWSDAGANCSKVIQICPDASWSDNVTNCKKNVPEYKLFSTF